MSELMAINSQEKIIYTQPTECSGGFDLIDVYDIPTAKPVDDTGNFDLVDINHFQDPFIKLAEVILNNADFASFTEYKQEMSALSKQFIELSKKIQTYIRHNNQNKINEAITYFNNYFEEMFSRILEYEYTTEGLDLGCYFDNIKQYISKYDIEYITRNKDSLVSTFQKEWELRRFQLDQIFNLKNEQNICKSNKKKGLIESISHFLQKIANEDSKDKPKALTFEETNQEIADAKALGCEEAENTNEIKGQKKKKICPQPLFFFEFIFTTSKKYCLNLIAAFTLCGLIINLSNTKKLSNI